MKMVPDFIMGGMAHMLDGTLRVSQMFVGDLNGLDGAMKMLRMVGLVGGFAVGVWMMERDG